MTAVVQRFSVTPFFRWYDLWVGAYWDRDNWVLYVCPVPMFGLKIKIPWRRESEWTFDDVNQTGGWATGKRRLATPFTSPDPKGDAP